MTGSLVPRLRPEAGPTIPKPPGVPNPGIATGWPLPSYPPPSTTSTSSAGSNPSNSARVQRSLISPAVASTSSTGTRRPFSLRCRGSTTRWVIVPAAGSTIVRLTTPQNPSVQLAFAPRENRVRMTAFLSSQS